MENLFQKYFELNSVKQLQFDFGHNLIYFEISDRN